jgi:hypothetical protein
MPIPVIVPVIAGAAALYLIFRKKAPSAAPSVAAATFSAAVPAPVATAAPPSVSSFAQEQDQSSEEDQSIVEAALAQFATERGASIQADPLVEQTIDATRSRAPSISAIPGTAETFLDPSGLRKADAPAPIEETDEPTLLEIASSAASDPFGTFFGA